jgi:hypothetical protein
MKFRRSIANVCCCIALAPVIAIFILAKSLYYLLFGIRCIAEGWLNIFLVITAALHSVSAAICDFNVRLLLGGANVALRIYRFFGVPARKEPYCIKDGEIR